MLEHLLVGNRVQHSFGVVNACRVSARARSVGISVCAVVVVVGWYLVIADVVVVVCVVSR
eukprot:1134613-Rhodomonas_salina.1